jgi:hypothetical protein
MTEAEKNLLAVRAEHHDMKLVSVVNGLIVLDDVRLASARSTFIGRLTGRRLLRKLSGLLGRTRLAEK